MQYSSELNRILLYATTDKEFASDLVNKPNVTLRQPLPFNLSTVPDHELDLLCNIRAFSLVDLVEKLSKHKNNHCAPEIFHNGSNGGQLLGHKTRSEQSAK